MELKTESACVSLGHLLLSCRDVSQPCWEPCSFLGDSPCTLLPTVVRIEGLGPPATHQETAPNFPLMQQQGAGLCISLKHGNKRSITHREISAPPAEPRCELDRLDVLRGAQSVGKGRQTYFHEQKLKKWASCPFSGSSIPGTKLSRRLPLSHPSLVVFTEY